FGGSDAATVTGLRITGPDRAGVYRNAAGQALCRVIPGNHSITTDLAESLRTRSTQYMKTGIKFLLTVVSAATVVHSFAARVPAAIEDQRFGVMTHFAQGWDPS